MLFFSSCLAFKGSAARCAIVDTGRAHALTADKQFQDKKTAFPIAILMLYQIDYCQRSVG
jgi:hypothetical protein